MQLSRTTPRDGGSSAGTARRMSSWMIAVFASLVLANPALAYAVADTTDEASTATAVVRLAQAQTQPTPPAPSPAPAPPAPAAAPTAAAQGAASAEPIGNVATLAGAASVVRNQNTLPLKLKDDIYLNDVVTTFADSTVGITFNDETTFNLTAKASITIDNYIYEEGGQQNSALFDVTKGTVAFVASQVAKTGNMKIQTPTATLGIRGTTGLVEVDGAGSGAHNIKLYPDPDGHVGTIDVNDRNGARLGTLNQGSSGFTIRPGAGGRVTAAPLSISPQQAARDQGVVRQVHAAQAVGRQVVSEQRALRRANPNRPQSAPAQRQNNLQQRPNNQPQQRQNNPQQRQNNLQQRPAGPQQPASPNRAGQPAQPATPNHATERTQPQQPQNVQRPNAPALRQGGLPNRPAAPPRRAPPPPKKPQKKR
jgi:FecR-like protein